MTGSSHRLLRTGIAAALTAAACWFWLPGTPLEQQAFRTLVSSTSESPPKFAGDGTRTSPWKVMTRQEARTVAKPPAVVTLNNDSEGIFSTFPHAPIDFAVILSNMHRLGARKLSCAPLLAWEQPDPIGLAALEKEMDAFDSILIATPITRGPVMQPLPAPLRRASVPIEDVRGDTSTLPIVNRVSLPNLIYGGDLTIAGFSGIDSEPESDSIPLLARWDYRVVLGFPLLAAMQQLGISPEQIEIRVGHFIKLGPDGPRIKINEFGHMQPPVGDTSDSLTIGAETLIDAEPSQASKFDFQSPLLCDNRSIADPSTLALNRQLPTIVQALTNGITRTITRTYHRPVAASEVCSLITLCFILAVLAGLGPWARIGSYLGIILCYAAAQYLSLIQLDLWLPGLPATFTTIAAALCSIGTNGNDNHVLKENDGLNYVRYSGDQPS